MKSATLFVVSCVLMFFVLHNTKVEAKDHAPEIVVHLTKGICHEDPTIAAKQCFYEVLNEEGDDYYTRCNCRDADGRQGDFGHYCTCFH
ncbi:hypothetical protein IGI04_021102 [Brassica rapa subsp. trilocularis]|uniref:Uncharacterized protein n=5 Tax=Brassica TaxID=3705 RepID=A0A8D9DJ49_BRACM|nr:hypothetical protein IGI04_021102 [Brassica rapa subsp. trilocularis]CAF2102942.1 unnamed protein product [Brassica napus]CAG7878257.1 unnamed protein product [Brassica rapa]